jgi:ubiquitin-protein ligase
MPAMNVSINRELADLSKEDMGGMTLAPTDANLLEWKATIPGPQGSPYEGGLFHVDIILPEDYPYVLESKAKSHD